MLASPPAWLPGPTTPLNWPLWPRVYSSHHASRSSSFRPTSGVTARRVSMNSTPWISGVSDRIAVPPWRTRMSIAAPSAGLAVMPEKPSEPPHSRPIFRWLALTGSRLTALAAGSISSIAAMPAAMVARVPPVSCMTSVRTFGARLQALRLDQAGDLVALAAQADDQHAGQVRVARVAGDRATQHVEVIARRRHAAAAGLRERGDAVDVRDRRPAARA